ncbi:MAG: hypothetical protein A7316_03080 [Candidatus Altiarchaeales archaeon WOR_SM1_86-2]|nr:MAG: hypothetical protein A7316_03080 [Candidatus Altiarchaeales archaeon WOR_SM1_86-2]
MEPRVGIRIGILVTGAVLISGCVEEKPVEKPPIKCVIENCHGLNISCGPNVPEVCTEIYMLGDGCREYASCRIIDGKCQLTKEPEFDECKSCVEKCLEDFKDDATEVFQCESECREKLKEEVA